jgi:hypothetical protein
MAFSPFPDQAEVLGLSADHVESDHRNGEVSGGSLDPFAGFGGDLELAQFFMPNELQSWFQQSGGGK